MESETGRIAALVWHSVQLQDAEKAAICPNQAFPLNRVQLGQCAQSRHYHCANFSTCLKISGPVGSYNSLGPRVQSAEDELCASKAGQPTMSFYSVGAYRLVCRN